MHTGREQYSRSIQSEVGCGYQRGATFVVPHFFPLDEEAPDHQLGREQAESAPYMARLPVQLEARLATALLSGDARFAVYCPTLTKGTSGRKKYQKKVSPKGGDPPQKFGKESTNEASYIVRSVCDVPWSPTSEAVKGMTVVLTLLPVRWQSSTLAGEP